MIVWLLKMLLNRLFLWTFFGIFPTNPVDRLAVKIAIRIELVNLLLAISIFL